MPTVTLNKTEFEKLVGKELPLEQLKDRISMLGTDLEGIEGEEIKVEIFPNRPDLLSEQGFARAFSSFIGVKTGLREYNVESSGMKVIVDSSVTMRPFTACAIVKGLSFTDEKIREIMQIQEKLATTHGRNRKKSAYGIYPAKKIKFPIRYIAKNPKDVLFKPLGFDEEVTADEIIETHPKGKTYKNITEGWEKYPFFIDAEDNVMCMLPFTNSEDTGKVELDTTEVFVECTGTDLQNVMVALNIIVTTLADMGGKIYSVDIEYPDQKITTPNLKPPEMEIDLNLINKLLGLELKEKDAKDLLEKMGYGYESGKVKIPAYRADILHQVDLAEDIAIAYGYENFIEEIPNVATIGKENPLEKFMEKIRDILIGLQLIEVKNFHLTTKEDLTEKIHCKEEPISLQNAIGEHNHLRNKIFSSLLKNLQENQHHEYPQNIFEIGRIFESGKTETGVVETENLAIALCHDKVDFTQIKQILDVVAKSLGLTVSIKETEHPSFIRGRVGKIFMNNIPIGLIGEIHPEVLGLWTIQVPIAILEINLEKLFSFLV
ncbi:MAG: phenylalanine--tRNA ligase subunit beta [archaeon]|nr:phenylalanine--tRNA ligase subunit beta [archaeon]